MQMAGEIVKSKIVAKRSSGTTDEESARLALEYEVAWLDILGAVGEVSARIERDFAKITGGVPLVEFDVLRCLGNAKGGALPVSQLTRATQLSRSAVTRLVDRMESSNGYVQKRNKVGREVWTDITPAGRATLKDTLIPAWERAVRRHFASHVSKDKASAVAAVLCTVLRGAGGNQSEKPSETP